MWKSGRRSRTYLEQQNKRRGLNLDLFKQLHLPTFSCFVHCMTQSRQITDPDNRFGLIAFSNLCPIPPHAGASVPDQRSLGVVDSLVPFAIR